MRKFVQIAFPALAVAMFALSLVSTEVGAITGWNAGRIIDDSVFTANTSMSTSQIQTFLNAKVPTCDTYGQQNSELGGPDLNKDGRVQRWEYGKSRWNQTTFPCLKDYTQGGKKASQIIYDVAQKYRISPKVLLVMLQKEQSLVTDTWPSVIQYRGAMGYGCPDTAPCDTQYYGLTNQLDWGAKMFRAIMDDVPTWYTPYNLGNNYIQYNPVKSCGGSTVNIQNRATQALYNYTPYQPNAGALAAGWGSAQCGAYGNRNFYLYFSNWFGQPNAATSYGFSLVSRQIYSDSAYTAQIATDTLSIKPNTPAYVRVTVKNIGTQVWYQDFLRLGTNSPQNRSSVFYDSSWVSTGRAAKMAESSVAPGGTATFNFRINAPNQLGNFEENFGVLIEGQRWLSGAIKFIYNVETSDPFYAVKTTGLSVYRDSARTRKLSSVSSVSTYPDSKLYLTVNLKNLGNRDLPADLTKIATTGPRNRASVFSDSSWQTSNRPSIANEGALSPGEIGTFQFSITVPTSQTADVNEQFGLVIEGDRWVNDIITTLPINVSPRPESQLLKGQSISRGQLMLSGDERFRLVLQGDGNLVLYSVDTGRALWNTRTNGKGGNKLVLQGDGNLVLYTSGGKAVWNTRTNGAS